MKINDIILEAGWTDNIRNIVGTFSKGEGPGAVTKEAGKRLADLWTRTVTKTAKQQKLSETDLRVYLLDFCSRNTGVWFWPEKGNPSDNVKKYQLTQNAGAYSQDVYKSFNQIIDATLSGRTGGLDTPFAKIMQVGMADQQQVSGNYITFKPEEYGAPLSGRLEPLRDQPNAIIPVQYLDTVYIDNNGEQQSRTYVRFNGKWMDDANATDGGWTLNNETTEDVDRIKSMLAWVRPSAYATQLKTGQYKEPYVSVTGSSRALMQRFGKSQTQYRLLDIDEQMNYYSGLNSSQAG